MAMITEGMENRVFKPGDWSTFMSARYDGKLSKASGASYATEFERGLRFAGLPDEDKEHQSSPVLSW